MTTEDNSKQVFRLGITMAGAASAGCYTAGAMDYIFEVLDLWGKAKQGKLPEDWGSDIYQYVPKDYSVTIDVMGGTSAGGMTAVMSTIYALKGVVNPVNKPENKTGKKNNILYDSWVLMGDEEKSAIRLLEKVFDTADLTRSGKIESLLNSDFIDAICENAFNVKGSKEDRLPFVSKDLELILSHTILRGIPLAVDFNTPIGLERKKKNPEHNSFEHHTVSHFKLNFEEDVDRDKYLKLDPFNDPATLKLATKATGAFPVGLRFREFFENELTTFYLQHKARMIAFNRLSDIPQAEVPDIKWRDKLADPFKFVSIDGGAINNEPYGEVLAVLKQRYGKKEKGEDYKYAVIMIDPFPDLPSPKPYEQPDDLFSVVPAIIETLWDQAKVKRGELLDAYSSDYYRGQIFPVRWMKQGVTEPYAIASSAAMAFGAFLDIDFRHHDFFLGRDNARNFLRTFFTLEYYEDEKDPSKNRIHPIHKGWSKEMIDLFKMPGKNGSFYLPIVPDLNFLKEKLDGTYKGPFQRTVKEWPVYNPEPLFALKEKMTDRAEKMLELAYSKMTAAKEKSAVPVTEAWIKHHYRKNCWQKFTGWVGSGVIRFLLRTNKRKIADRLTKAAITWVLKDLETKGLLKKAGVEK
jgi:hypothetical protein